MALLKINCDSRGCTARPPAQRTCCTRHSTLHSTSTTDRYIHHHDTDHWVCEESTHNIRLFSCKLLTGHLISIDGHCMPTHHSKSTYTRRRALSKRPIQLAMHTSDMLAPLHWKTAKSIPGQNNDTSS
eukprot:scpid7198/ scgid19146/ 